MLSSNSDPTRISEALIAGVTDFLQKPVDELTLVAKIETYCRPRSKAGVANYGIFLDNRIDKSIYLQDVKLDLTRSEYQVLSHLLREQGRWQTFDSLSIIIDEDTSRSGLQSAELFLHRLKKKVNFAELASWKIEIIYGYGFRLVYTREYARFG